MFDSLQSNSELLVNSTAFFDSLLGSSGYELCLRCCLHFHPFPLLGSLMRSATRFCFHIISVRSCNTSIDDRSREDRYYRQTINEIEAMVMVAENSDVKTTNFKHKCTICHSPAKLCCTGCDTIRLSSEDPSEKNWYCTRDCLLKDRPNHKAHCKKIKSKVDLQSLQRATRVLQALFNLYRDVD